MSKAPTSLRISPAEEVLLAELLEALPRVRPDLATLAPGGVLTRGSLLRLALARGLRSLRDEVTPSPPLPLSGGVA